MKLDVQMSKVEEHAFRSQEHMNRSKEHVILSKKHVLGSKNTCLDHGSTSSSKEKITCFAERAGHVCDNCRDNATIF